MQRACRLKLPKFLSSRWPFSPFPYYYAFLTSEFLFPSLISLQFCSKFRSFILLLRRSVRRVRQRPRDRFEKPCFRNTFLYLAARRPSRTFRRQTSFDYLLNARFSKASELSAPVNFIVFSQKKASPRKRALEIARAVGYNKRPSTERAPLLREISRLPPPSRRRF